MFTQHFLRIGIILVAAGFASAWTTPVPLTELNTSYQDASPFLSSDGKTIYFNRQDADTFYYHRIYQATRSNASDSFTNVSEISSLNYSGGHVMGPWVSPDNLRMYYTRTEPGSNWVLRLSQRASASDSWPVGNYISELNSLGQVAGMDLTSDELTAVFGCNRPDGLGGWDSYIATRPDRYSPFSNIRNLTELNSADNDNDPFISPDGLTFCWTKGAAGATQLYMATRSSLNDSFGNVQRLTFADSIGGGIRNPFISANGTEFYFTKQYYDTGGNLTTDLYVSYIPEPATLLLLGLGGVLLRGRK
jgi:Tol biopolymer transport system component